MRFNALTRAIFVQYKTLFDRTGPAVLALILVAMAVVIVAARGARRGPRRGPVRGAAAAARAPAPVELGPLALAGARVLRAGRRRSRSCCRWPCSACGPRARSRRPTRSATWSGPG